MSDELKQVIVIRNDLNCRTSECMTLDGLNFTA